MPPLDAQTFQSVDAAVHKHLPVLECRIQQVPSSIVGDVYSITTLPRAATVGLVWPSTTQAHLDRMESSVTSDLDRYARFPPGWDGYDGVTFDAQLVSVVQRVAKWTADLFRTLDVVPSEMTPGPASDGSLDLEIAYQGKRLILTFYPETDRVGVYCENGADAEEAQTTLDSSGLARWLSWLVG